MTELDFLRKRIDAIDQKIVRLLEERMALARRVGEYKAANNLPVLDSEREKAVIQSRAGMLMDKEMEGVVTELFEHIMQLSREHQGRVRD